MHLLKKIFWLLKDAFSVIKSKKKSNGSNYLYLYKLFVIRFFYGAAYFRNKITIIKNLPNIKFYNTFFLHHENEKLFLNDFLNEIDDKGYVKLKSKVKTDVIEDLSKDALSSIESEKIINFDQDDFKNLESVFQKMKSEKIFSIKHNVKIQDSSIIKKFATDDFFINLSQRYLSTNKLSINIQLLISQNLNNKSISDIEYSRASQLYHADVDFKKFFKLFVYLNDINTLDRGPHEFVTGSHKKKPHELYVTSRFPDLLIKKNYTEQVKFYGDRGTSFIVDTFGIHKGCKLTGNNSRAVLAITYGKDHFKFSKNTIFLN